MAGDPTVQAMQHAINRYWGQLLGASIKEDGIDGTETSGAIDVISAGMQDVASGFGLSYAAYASALNDAYNHNDFVGATGWLNKVADEQNWNYDAAGVKSDGGGPTGSGSAQPQRKVAPTKVTAPGSFSASLNSIASKLGLPTWALYLSGAAIAIGTTAVIVKKHKEHRPALRRRAA